MNIRILVFAIVTLAGLLGGPTLVAQPTVRNTTADDKVQVNPLQVSLLNLGSVWQVTECCGWTGTWTRRPGTNTFDAKFKHTNGTSAQDVLTLKGWNAQGQLVISRPSLNGSYVAAVNTAAKTMEGTATWYTPGARWSARY
jgi:hypothetical protein